MDDNPEEHKEKEQIKDCQKTVSSLVQEYESLIQKQKSTDTAGHSDRSVKKACLADVASKQLIEVGKVKQQVELSDDNNGQIGANLNPSVQALFNGTLPDDFYLHLMSVIGIQECLISNRLVCSLWNDLVLERCHNQKSLKLFENFKCLINYGEWLLKSEKTDDTSLILKSIGDDLIFEALETDHEQLVSRFNPDVILAREKKLEASKVLTALFPSVEELVLVTEFPNTFINMDHLLQFYAEQLTSLTITNFEQPYFQRLNNELRGFNFPQLKSLNLSSEDRCKHYLEDQLLSLLPQLESLTLYRTEISLETLLRTGTQLQELSIDWIESVYTAPVEEFSKRTPINSNLRKFSLNFPGFVSKPEVMRNFISQNVTSLECLKLYYGTGCYYDYTHLHSLTSNLVPLQQLHSLTLQAPISFFILNDNQFAQIQPLPSVRQLKLLLPDTATTLFYEPMKDLIDKFSKPLFAAFPQIEQILIGFVNIDCVEAATFAAFEYFAGKHPNVVQLFRSKNISEFTSLPNAVSPLLGHRRQMYEEYIAEVELFGVPICKLASYMVTRQGEDGPNLKIVLRPADRLTALSNLLQLLESGAFSFTIKKVEPMLEHTVKCALMCGPSQVALFAATCKCIISFLDCPDVKVNMPAYFVNFVLQLVKHYREQQFKDTGLLRQLRKSEGKFIYKS